MALDPAWLPAVPMKRVIVHWTAGAHTAGATDRKAYHILIEGDGKVVRGTPSIALNSGSIKPGYAAHALNANTDSIGVSLCCMAGAVESPFDAGRFPMTARQFEVLVEVVADLCRAYSIPVTTRTVLSHAEVQGTLGITQRGKWDYTRLAFERAVMGGPTIGARLRDMVSAAMGQGAPAPAPLPPPAGGVGIVTASSLNLRRSPSTTAESRGTIPRGTPIELLEPSEAGDWLLIRTPFGIEGWVAGQHVEIMDGPEPEAPTMPHPARVTIAGIRAQLEILEAQITGA